MLHSFLGPARVPTWWSSVKQAKPRLPVHPSGEGPLEGDTDIAPGPRGQPRTEDGEQGPGVHGAGQEGPGGFAQTDAPLLPPLNPLQVPGT